MAIDRAWIMSQLTDAQQRLVVWDLICATHKDSSLPALQQLREEWMAKWHARVNYDSDLFSPHPRYYLDVIEFLIADHGH